MYPVCRQPRTLSEAIVEVAREELARGVEECPPGSNRGPDVDRYLLGHDGRGSYLLCAATLAGRMCPTCGGRDPRPECVGVPWCARYAAWVVREAALRLGLPCPTDGWGDLASGRKWIDKGHLYGKLAQTDRREPLPAPGRIGVVPRKGGSHVVVVEGIEDDAMLTLEGNLNQRVAAERRPIAALLACIDLEAS